MPIWLTEGFLADSEKIFINIEFILMDKHD